MSKEMIREQLDDHLNVHSKISSEMVDFIYDAVDVIRTSLEQGGKVLLCGNGGSAAESQHIAAEFVGRFRRERAGMPAIALTTDTSILTSLGNDYGYQAVFARQVEALGKSGDVLIGYSTSGRSENILLAFEKARVQGMKLIAFTGANGGSMAAMADVALKVPSTMTARIQEGHSTIGHIICDLIELWMTQQASSYDNAAEIH